MNSGDTAWIIVATALVLFMILPGLAMFYAGLVRANSVLSVVMHCFSIAAVASLLWLFVGYSLAFSDSLVGILGGLDNAFFAGIKPDTLKGSIPEIVYVIFQLTFAIITPALIVGAVAGLVCFFAVDVVKGRLKIDDSLDVFAVHGVGGTVGTLLVSVLAIGALGGGGLMVESGAIGVQLGDQALGVVATVAWAAVIIFIIVKVTAVLTGGLRVDEKDEQAGLDLVTHGERGYDL